MAALRKRSRDEYTGAGMSTTGVQTAVQTIRDSGGPTRTHVQYAPLFVLAQDYDDVVRALRGALEPVQYAGMSHEDQMTLTLFASVSRVVADMVHRADRIATLSMTPDPVGHENGSLEALRARQVTEQALVREGMAAIEADIALLRSRLAETHVEHRADNSRQLMDVAPFPQPGSAAAELSVLLSSNRARHGE